jgi:hypothetical protein
MPRAPAIRKADLDRVLKAIADAGQIVARVEIRPGGQIDIIPALTSDISASQLDELEAWRAKRGGRAAQRVS